MRVDDHGKAKLSEWEGCREESYLDSGGEPTIGVGHCLTRAERISGKLLIDGVSVDYCNGLTAQQCLDLLAQDLAGTEKAVSDAVTVPLTQNQFNALVSFAFNVGNEAFRSSTLLKCLNQGQYEAVPTQLRRWVYDNGVVVQGLRNRRENEITLWELPDTVEAPYPVEVPPTGTALPVVQATLAGLQQLAPMLAPIIQDALARGIDPSTIDWKKCFARAMAELAAEVARHSSIS
jgi:lysozyme